MNSKFLNWYTQALGGTIGIIACTYAYLNGYIQVYSNIMDFADYIGIQGVVASYFLLPLCMATLILGIISSYTEDMSEKNLVGIPLSKINNIVIFSTVIIGLLGARFVFIIPTVFILFDNFTHTESFNRFTLKLHNRKKENLERKKEKLEKLKSQKAKKEKVKSNKNKVNKDTKNTIVFNSYSDENNKKKLIQDEEYLRRLRTRETIAIDLLSKNASKEFIKDLTGFSLVEINKIENNYKKHI